MKRIILIIFVFTVNQVYSQGKLDYSKESPNVASLGVFQKNQVNHFTGTPDISIPIYEIKSGNINFPITLRYNQASVKPNSHPGWVGLGWNLNSYGVISRKQNFLQDESSKDHSFYDAANVFHYIRPTYYPLPDQSGSGAENINQPLWYTNTALNQFSMLEFGDVHADEFNFNFMGYSGTFVWTANGWIVVSDANINVELSTYPDDFVLATRVVPSLQSKMSGLNWSGVTNTQTRNFKEFILTTDDGTKYYFGGEDAIEYTTDFAMTEELIASAWYLRKIKDIYGNEVEFTYHRNKPICQLAFYSGHIDFFQSLKTDGGFLYTDCSVPSGTVSNVYTNRHDGNMIFPVYLSSIISKNEIIEFQTSESTEKTYLDDYFLLRKDGDGSTAYRISLFYAQNPKNYIGWEKLDYINIKQKSGIIEKYYSFNYSNSTDQRLTLNSLFEKDKNNNVGGKYYFYYNDVVDMPIYGGNYTDHWGYFNNLSVNNTSFSEINFPNSSSKKRTINTTITKNGVSYPLNATGLLNKIVYPTGGYTKFTWEVNSYSKVVNSARNNLENETNIVGGSRIMEIIDCNDDGGIINHRRFYYLLNFQGAITGLQSSGILNGKPKYYFSFATRPSTLGADYVYSVTESNLNALTDYSSCALGSHIGYSEVVEKNMLDNSYSKYYYSNFGIDANGQNYFDQYPVNYIGWVPAEFNYMPLNEKNIERGKLHKIEHYNNLNNIVESSIYNYTTDNNRFDNYVRMFKFNNSYVCPNSPSDGIMFATAYKLFTYKYNMIEKINTKYDINNQNPITTREEYGYNEFNLLQTKTFYESDSWTRTKYKYPQDYAITGFYNNNRKSVLNMQDPNLRNMLNYPIEIIKYENGNVIDATVNFYDIYALPDAPLISKVYKLEINKPITNYYVETYFDSDPNHSITMDSRLICQTTNVDYDGNSNLLQYYNNDNIEKSFIYDNEFNFLTAQVTNATYEEIFFNNFETNLDANANSDSYSGLYSYKVLPNAFGPGKEFEKWSAPISDKYKFSVWIKTPASYDNNKGKFVIDVRDGDNFNTILAYHQPWVGNTNNTWKYYETTFDLSAVAAANPGKKLLVRCYVWNTDPNNYLLIDDMRFYPSDSKMTTYTIHPFYGMTSISDNNSLPKHYDYDSFGRLYRIRDFKNNILKQYEYHYK